MLLLFSQTLDVLLQILVVFPKVEPLRCKVWFWAFSFNVLLISPSPTASYFTAQVTDFCLFHSLSLCVFFLVKSGHIIYSPHGGHLRNIRLSLSPQDIGAVACGKWGISISYWYLNVVCFSHCFYIIEQYKFSPWQTFHFWKMRTPPLPLFFCSIALHLPILPLNLITGNCK